MNGFIKEFKTFALRGNVLDMAVGVVIGGAFGKIVSSLVNDIIMPLVGWLVGGTDMDEYKFVIPAREGIMSDVPAATISYGTFIQNCVDFLIIAFSIFVAIKAINKLTSLHTKEEEKPEEPTPAEPSEEVKLLTEIRDSLKK